MPGSVTTALARPNEFCVASRWFRQVCGGGRAFPGRWLEFASRIGMYFLRVHSVADEKRARLILFFIWAQLKHFSMRALSETSVNFAYLRGANEFHLLSMPCAKVRLRRAMARRINRWLVVRLWRAREGEFVRDPWARAQNLAVSFSCVPTGWQ